VQTLQRVGSVGLEYYLLLWLHVRRRRTSTSLWSFIHR